MLHMEGLQSSLKGASSLHDHAQTIEACSTTDTQLGNDKHLPTALPQHLQARPVRLHAALNLSRTHNALDICEGGVCFLDVC